MKLAVALLLVGTGLLAYAMSLPAYTDERLFEERYMALPSGASEEYWKLRDEMLTRKFEFEDYGATLIVVAVLFAVFAWRGYPQIRAPASRPVLIALAVVLPFASVGAFVIDLFISASRGEFPPWADSLGIPLMGAPLQLAILLVWSLAHLRFVRGEYPRVAPLAPAISSRSNWWLVGLSALGVVLVALLIAGGHVLYAIAGTLWVYFFLSLAAIRLVGHGA